MPLHLTAEDIIRMFQSNSIELHGEKVVPLFKDISGFIVFTNDNGGTVYLVDPDSHKRLASLPVRVTKKIRQSKCDRPGCSCNGGKWNELLYGCKSDKHQDVRYDDELMPVKVYAGFCQNPHYTEQHVWLMSECTDSVAHYETYAQIL
jgi:hypothetical protein